MNPKTNPDIKLESPIYLGQRGNKKTRRRLINFQFFKAQKVKGFGKKKKGRKKIRRKKKKCK